MIRHVQSTVRSTVNDKPALDRRFRDGYKPEVSSDRNPGDLPAGLSIRPYRLEDESHVVDTLQAAFGTWPGDIVVGDPAAYLRWKHLQSPWVSRSCLSPSATRG